MKKEVIAEALSEVQDQFIEEAAIEPDAARTEKNSYSPDGENGSEKDEKKDRKKQKKPIVIPFPSGRWVKAGIGVCAAIVLCLTAAAIHEPLKRRSAAKTDYAVSEDMDTGTGGYSGAYSMKAENSAAFERKTNSGPSRYKEICEIISDEIYTIKTPKKCMKKVRSCLFI